MGGKSEVMGVEAGRTGRRLRRMLDGIKYQVP